VQPKPATVVAGMRDFFFFRVESPPSSIINQSIWRGDSDDAMMGDKKKLRKKNIPKHVT
jgi:hypothetical protein